MHSCDLRDLNLSLSIHRSGGKNEIDILRVEFSARKYTQRGIRNKRLLCGNGGNERIRGGNVLSRIWPFSGYV